MEKIKKTILHFLHGSVSKKRYKHDEYSIRGGLLGGHIYIQINSHIYSFEPRYNDDFHIFPRKNPYAFNSNLKKIKYEDWINHIESKKMTSIEIPLNEAMHSYLKNLLKQYKLKTPFDYAFFGMRCASFTHYLLSKINIFSSTGWLQSIVLFPYPRKLRKELIKKAKLNSWKIYKISGSGTRTWENDESLHLKEIIS